MRKAFVIGWLAFLSAGIAFLFWRNELKYHLPTPVPANYHDVGRGTAISLPPSAAALFRPATRPLFLHFFNPDCPCSRFNMPQFRALVQQYHDRIGFAIVVMSPQKFTAAQIQDKFNLPFPVPVMQDSAIAAACGVYSTPQAVLIAADGRLYFRGNYNRSRYCTDEKTGFAKQAVEGLLHGNYSLTFSPLALKAYGCTLPTCNQ